MGLKSGGLRGSLRNIGTGVYAIPGSVIDHFEATLYEDQSLSLSDYYSGDLAQFTRQQTTVLEGEYTLETSSDGGQYFLYDNGNLNNYPSQGQRFRFKAQLSDQDNNGFLLFGGPNENNCYGIGLGSAGNQFTLAKFSSGSFTSLADESYTFSTDTQYEVEVGWSTSGDFDVTLFQGGSTEVDLPVVSDTEFNADGLGFQTNTPSSTTVYYDDIRDVGAY